MRPGQFAATDSIVRAGAGWVRGTDGTTTTLVGTGTDATATVPMHGTEIAAIGEGAVRVAVDGHDCGMVRLAPGKITTLVTDLADGIHTVVLRPADANASVRLQRLLVGRQPPFAWAFPLFTLGAMITALGAVGVLVREGIGAGRARRVASAWHAAAEVDPRYMAAYDVLQENEPDDRRSLPPNRGAGRVTHALARAASVYRDPWLWTLGGAVALLFLVPSHGWRSCHSSPSAQSGCGGPHSSWR